MMTITELVKRMNYIASLSTAERVELDADCTAKGHVASGERVMVNPFIDVCSHCGREFRIKWAD